MVEARAWAVVPPAHVPLPDERCLVAGLLQEGGEDAEVIRILSAVVHNAMIVGVKAGKYGGAARRAKAPRHKGVGEVDALRGEPVDLGRLKVKGAP